jgi:predicted metal-binding membrane protein
VDRLSARLIAPSLVAGALAAWIVTVQRMQGMNGGPGTNLGAIGWYLGIWATMMAAMMLPAVMPVVLLFARAARQQGNRLVGAWTFFAGYLLVWVVFGLVAYGIFRLVRRWTPGFIAWDSGGRYVAAGALIAAGVYQLGSLKSLCLRHCRSPIHFLLHRWRPGLVGAVRMGAEHGAYCVGCCFGLMLALFALGVMSLFWMVVVAAAIFAEKVLPFGERLAPVLAVALVGLGIWVAVDPGSVPGLTIPGQMPANMNM